MDDDDFSGDRNERDTGARKYPIEKGLADSTNTVDPDVGPKKPYGLTQAVDEVEDKTHQSDGQEHSADNDNGADDKLRPTGP